MGMPTDFLTCDINSTSPLKKCGSVIIEIASAPASSYSFARCTNSFCDPSFGFVGDASFISEINAISFVFSIALINVLSLPTKRSFCFFAIISNNLLCSCCGLTINLFVSFIRFSKTFFAVPLSITSSASFIPSGILPTFPATTNATALLRTTISRFAFFSPSKIFFKDSAFSSADPPVISFFDPFPKPNCFGSITNSFFILFFKVKTCVGAKTLTSSIPSSLVTITKCSYPSF